MSKPICAVDGCDKPVASRGWCWSHYERWRKHGTPFGGRPTYATEHDRFWASVDTSGDCRVWIGARKPGGYGVFKSLGRTYNAHRWAYAEACGEIPPGLDLDLDHLCRNRACVRPDHLEPVTRKVNLNRGRNWLREKTHCKRGHPFDSENTAYDVKGKRRCRACTRLRTPRVGRPRVPDDVIRQISTLHAAGLSAYKIAGRLTSDGVPTAEGGERWSQSSVQRILDRLSGRPRSPR